MAQWAHFRARSRLQVEIRNEWKCWLLVHPWKRTLGRDLKKRNLSRSYREFIYKRRWETQGRRGLGKLQLERSLLQGSRRIDLQPDFQIWSSQKVQAEVWAIEMFKWGKIKQWMTYLRRILNLELLGINTERRLWLKNLSKVFQVGALSKNHRIILVSSWSNQILSGKRMWVWRKNEITRPKLDLLSQHHPKSTPKVKLKIRKGCFFLKVSKSL